jgi:hypothetical protein
LYGLIEPNAASLKICFILTSHFLRCHEKNEFFGKYKDSGDEEHRRLVSWQQLGSGAFLLSLPTGSFGLRLKGAEMVILSQLHELFMQAVSAENRRLPTDSFKETAR